MNNEGETFGYAEIYEPLGTIIAVLIVAFVSAKTGVASDSKYRELKDSTKKDQCKVYRNGLQNVVGSESGISFEPYFFLDSSTSFSVSPENTFPFPISVSFISARYIVTMENGNLMLWVREQMIRELENLQIGLYKL